MENKLTRNSFLATLTGTASLLFLGTGKKASAMALNSSLGDPSFHRYFPSQDPELVQEMVIVSHGQVSKVKELLAAHPELAKATWDFGFGDWETAIGAASHTGNKEIAELLMANGARPDIFTFTMLGNLPAVKAMIDDNPEIQKTKGPHGLSLLAHAKTRLASKAISDLDSKKAQAMVDYLTSLSDTDTKAVNLEITDADKKRLIGKFRFGEGPDDLFLIDVNDKGMLYIKKPGQRFERPLLRVEENGFAPLGAPHVRVLFEMKDQLATVLSIHDPAPMVKALRQ